MNIIAYLIVFVVNILFLYKPKHNLLAGVLGGGLDFFIFDTNIKVDSSKKPYREGTFIQFLSKCHRWLFIYFANIAHLLQSQSQSV